MLLYSRPWLNWNLVFFFYHFFISILSSKLTPEISFNHLVHLNGISIGKIRYIFEFYITKKLKGRPFKGPKDAYELCCQNDFQYPLDFEVSNLLILIFGPIYPDRTVLGCHSRGRRRTDQERWRRMKRLIEDRSQNHIPPWCFRWRRTS